MYIHYVYSAVKQYMRLKGCVRAKYVCRKVCVSSSNSLSCTDDILTQIYYFIMCVGNELSEYVHVVCVCVSWSKSLCIHECGTT